jgi:uncharacterized membrane protein HdeD (DUF308 family)
MVRAFVERAINSLWWLTLISGILMTILAFWTSGQLFIEKAYVLLVFAGIWALIEGIGDIVRAFERSRWMRWSPTRRSECWRRCPVDRERRSGHLGSR